MSKQDKDFKNIQTKLEKQGYRYAGVEPLNKYEFRQDRFIAIPDRTKEDILNQYGTYDVKLVDKIGPEKGQRAVYVFIKERKEI